MQPDSERSILLAGYTDLRRGIDGLASIIKFNFQLDPYEKDILFLFCGRRSDRIKGLVWEGDGFLLLYKRLELGGFSWPRTKEEALEDHTGTIPGVDAGAGRSSPDIRSGKCIPGIFCKALGKT